jgi:hypothetical protein
MEGCGVDTAFENAVNETIFAKGINEEADL